MAAAEDDDAWLYGGGEGPGVEKKEDENDLVKQDKKETGEYDEEDTEREAGEISGEDDIQETMGEESMQEDGQNQSHHLNLQYTEEDLQRAELLGLSEGEMVSDGLDMTFNEEMREDGEGGSDEDDSDDDDVQVTIGDIKSLPSYGYGATPVNLNLKRLGGFIGSGVTSSGGKNKGLDLDSVGVVNGVALYDFNLDTMEEKPWRKPGADITDYFNYGFNEDTWKIYCERQRKLRIDNNSTGKVSVNHVVVGGKETALQIASVNENSKYSVAATLGLKKAGPPPGRKLSGSIDVIGGGAPSLPSRRPVASSKENVITVMTGRKFDAPPPGVPPPHLAPTHLPPPSYLPPEANLSIPPPPPGTIPGLPPTNIPPPPPGTPFGDHFGSSRFSVPPPVIVGGVVQYSEEHAAYYNNGNLTTPATFDGESTQQSWTSASPRHRGERERSERDRERGEHRERSRDRVEHERTSSSYTAAWDYREHEATRERGERGMSSRSSAVGDEDYEQRRARHRDYHERPRERERDRDRERSSGYDYEREERYERERERRHKEHRSEREERHRERSSRRRHHHESEEEQDHRDHDHARSSRHKHKRSKREKDDETSSNAAASASETQDGLEMDIKQQPE